MAFASNYVASPERPIHDVSGRPTASCWSLPGGRGRVFEVENDRAFALVADMKEDYVIGLTPSSGGWLAHTARNGVVFRIDHAPAGGRLSLPGDRLQRARALGQILLAGRNGEGQRLTVAFRQGNALDPDQGSWQPWSAEQELAPTAVILIRPGPSRGTCSTA
jgi:hypothetical protein